MPQRYDWLIVGAGFTGATAARRLAEDFGQTVLLIDRRGHLGGNAWDRRDEGGYLVHAYGPHIFHTNSSRIFAFLSRFTEWRPYFHRVLAHVDGRLVPVPFNLDSMAALFPARMADRLTEKLIQRYGFGARPSIDTLRHEADDADLRALDGREDWRFGAMINSRTPPQWTEAAVIEAHLALYREVLARASRTAADASQL